MSAGERAAIEAQAAEALVTKAADKLKEKMQAKKGSGKPGELKQMTTGAKDLIKLHLQAEREAAEREAARRWEAAHTLSEFKKGKGKGY